jgi:hypothetical protein
MMEGVNSTMIYLIYCTNVCKCHNVPLTSTTIKKKKNLVTKNLPTEISVPALQKKRRKERNPDPRVSSLFLSSQISSTQTMSRSKQSVDKKNK